MWRPEVSLLPDACAGMLPQIQKREQACFQALELSGSTVYVNALRSVRLQRLISVVGMFSVLDAVLKDWRGWDDPAKQAVDELRSNGEADLAQRFQDYWDANNVLKHGRGRSYDKLVVRQGTLDFRLHTEDKPLFEEGDIADGHCLIDVTDHFVMAAAEVVREVAEKAKPDDFY